MRIALGIHIEGVVLPRVYLNHVSVMLKWAKTHDLVLCGTTRTKVASARNRIVDSAIEQDCSHVLFIDIDHILPDNMLDLLVENADAAMVSGLVCKRQFPYDAVAFNFLPDKSLDETIVKERGEVIERDACAMGCTLVNLEMIRKLNKPYFFDARLRSDLNLCLSFRNQGFRILIDTRVEIGHLGDEPIITPTNAEMLRKVYLEALSNEKICD